MPSPITAALRSLLQKAVRRGDPELVARVVKRFSTNSDKMWVGQRSFIFVFEEVWPLADGPFTIPDTAKAAKQKDGQGLANLAIAYNEGDQLMLDAVPDVRTLRIAAAAIRRSDKFFKWALGKLDHGPKLALWDQAEMQEQRRLAVIQNAQRFLGMKPLPGDAALAISCAVLAAVGDVPLVEPGPRADKPTPLWVAFDKHTPQGWAALKSVAPVVGASVWQLIWTSFYCESTKVNRLLPSPWWEADRTWHLRSLGLSPGAAEELWTHAKPLVRQRLEGEAEALRKFVEGDLTIGRAVNQ